MKHKLISIVVPTLREVANITTLARRISQSLDGLDFEIIIVDDNSQDGTVEKVQELSRELPIRVIVRTDTSDGLGGAVLAGLNDAKGDVFVVMDADLQHPPERIPALIEVIENEQGDFALGSRHVAGATTSENWSAFRKLNSYVATQLARPFAGAIKDPMSGFFALTRKTYERGAYLAPLGYKIALELICKCRVENVVEIPIHFGLREQGQSKLSLKQQFKYLEHLSRLYDFTFPRLAPATKFLVVVAMAWFVGAGTFSLARKTFTELPIAIGISYAFTIITAAIFHSRYVRTQRAWLIRPTAWRDFLISGLIELMVAMLVALFIQWRITAPTVVEQFVIPFFCATVVRYILRKEFQLDIRGLRFIPK
ncbi:MAG TPA: polyprenol monophosphomannose synthase [Tepidisphaeraceae bacterium]|nr:polyprenol monophosphomannose synthase [Tepidisphaeraceae bacterium]